MKNKILSLFFLIILFNLIFISAQQEGLENVPGGNLIKKAVNDEGEVKGITDIKNTIDNIQKNDNESYLRKEWTKILADNKFFGPVLFYTDKFFSFFNPIWRYSFGMEFAWNLIFFLHVFLWGVIIFVIYFPAKEIFHNSIFALITGIIFASITGSFGIITKFVNLLDVMFGKLLLLTIFVIILILLLILYGNFFESSRKESEEEELGRAKGNIKAHGKSSEKFFDEMGGG